MAKPTKQPELVVVPRLGPPTNLRPGGAHENKKRPNRAHEKAALRRAAFDVLGRSFAGG